MIEGDNSEMNEMETEEHVGCGCGCSDSSDCTCSHPQSSNNNHSSPSSSPSSSPHSTPPNLSPRSPPGSPFSNNGQSDSTASSNPQRANIKSESFSNNVKFDGECLELGRLEGEGEEEFIVRNCINISSTHPKLRHIVFLTSPHTNPSLLTKLEEHKVLQLSHFDFSLF